MKKKTVDIIVPCHDEGAALPLFHEAVREEICAIPEYSFRFIFVDDGSGDDTLKVIKDLARNRHDIGYISFSRQFGKEAGILAGLRSSTADIVVLMDADLQHPPALLRGMLVAVDGEGYDSCAARRVGREGVPRLRSVSARLFYRLAGRLFDVEIVDGAVDYRAMTRRVVDAVLSLPEAQRFSRGIFSWVGFRTKWVEFRSERRIAGESKWTLRRLVRYALGGMLSFTAAPLRLAAPAGLAVCLLSVCLLAWGLAEKVLTGGEGFPFLTVVLLLACGGILLACGILGEYLALIMAEVKRRPPYIERDSSFRKGRDA